MVIKPWGYALGKTSSEPMLSSRRPVTKMPISLCLFLCDTYSAAEHVEGFIAKECAVVTHSKLEAGEGGQVGASRPIGGTSPSYGQLQRLSLENSLQKWVQSYWRPSSAHKSMGQCRYMAGKCACLFLRTAEFLGGHTVHMRTMRKPWRRLAFIFDLYADFAKNYMAKCLRHQV